MGVKEAHTPIICQCHREWQPYSRVYYFLFPRRRRAYHGMAPFAGYPQPLFPPLPHRSRQPLGRGPPPDPFVAGPS
ncbi:hypothetical protein BQ8420_28855 [Nocardiopsis sp. JB363]|nr:hypothetical protein BQ8420_28855 [Nocardiopsis sp. JB363]